MIRKGNCLYGRMKRTNNPCEIQDRVPINKIEYCLKIKAKSLNMNWFPSPAREL